MTSYSMWLPSYFLGILCRSAVIVIGEALLLTCLHTLLSF